MPISPATFVNELEELLAEHADPDKAVQMKRYLRDQFEFLGLQSPLRKQLVKEYIKKCNLRVEDDLTTICRLCFDAEYREMHYVVGDLMSPLIKKLDFTFLELFHDLIEINSWWDTVDFLAPKLAGGLLLRFPKQLPIYASRWIQSPNFWYQRAGIIFQLSYKEKTNQKILFDNILLRANSKEFFVQKGAGWALRNYSRINPEAVKAFVDTNVLPKLTIREGMRVITPSCDVRK